jgi:hypothetical protein
MSSLIIRGDTSGAITLSAPNAAGSSTYTLPAVNGSVMVSGNIPAFSAYRSGSDQSFSATTWTKLQFNNEYLDTNNCYDTTNYRFTPNVAGYYLFTLTPLIGASSSLTEIYIQFYINGAGNNQYSLCSLASGAFNTFSPSTQTIVYMNGSSDYMEAYAYVGGTSPRFNAGGGVFTGVLVRAA